MSAASTKAEHSPPSRSGVPLGTAFTVFFAAVGLLIGRRAIGDNSFLTHFATGRLILETRSVPSTDPYSFTAAGDPWVVQSWLASVLYASLDFLLGGVGIRLLNGALCSATAAIVWKLTSRRSEQIFVPLGLSGAVLTIGATMWSPRPLLFGLLGLALVFAAVEGMIAPAWLIPVMWVWVNTHGSFPMAGVLVGTLGVGAWLEDRKFPDHEARVLGWVAAGILVGGINPLGPKLLWFPVQLLRRSEALKNVVEWRPFTLSDITSWIFLGLVVAFVAALIQRPSWRMIVPGSVFTLAALLAVRNVVMASVVLAVVSAPGLVMAYGQIRTTDTGPIVRFTLVGSILLGCVAALSTALSSPVDFASYPEEEIRVLGIEGLLDEDSRLIHPEIVGNYLSLKQGVEANVFIDDRFDFYPQQVIDDLEVMIYGGDYAAVIDRYEPDAILWTAGGGFEAWLEERSEWAVAEPLMLAATVPGESAKESDWFIARRSSATPSPEVLASNP